MKCESKASNLNKEARLTTDEAVLVRTSKGSPSRTAFNLAEQCVTSL